MFVALGWRRIAAGFAALTVFGCALVGCGDPPGSKPFADVVRDAETASDNFEDFPPSYRQDRNHEAILQPMLDRAQASLARYYSGDLLAERVRDEQQALRQTIAAAGGGRVGGVSDLSVSDLRISGHQASAHARVTVWFKTAQFSYQDPRAFPSATNVLDLDLHFVRVEGTWKIDRETESFAPGGGP